MRTARAVPKAAPVSPREVISLFADFETVPALVLAVSGGPDSTALMVLAAQWRDALKTPPQLVAVTVDHGLRAASKREAANVGRLARKLGIAHRTLRWTGRKPAAGLPQAARLARYRLLGEAARKAGAAHIVTAHTLDDQAETVLIRLLRGSGITGLGAMARLSKMPGSARGGAVFLLRPLLGIAKARLIATLRAAKIPYADDPSNRDPRFTRARLRGLMPQLAREGLDARGLARLAHRLRRADAAIEALVDQAMAALAQGSATLQVLRLDAAGFFRLPAEVGLRLIGRAVGQVGDEGPVELAKLEALKAALDKAFDVARQPPIRRFRRSLAGALVTLAMPQITVERAPSRRRKSLTTRRPGKAKPAESR